MHETSVPTVAAWEASLATVGGKLYENPMVVRNFETTENFRGKVRRPKGAAKRITGLRAEHDLIKPSLVPGIVADRKQRYKMLHFGSHV